ncbi:MAG: hypothetical protein M1816_003778 [Peltula sp. TS41687]|nr:MAG: hypothetical protein M1816_003778 [Peltula sp. TS41687]
MKTRKRSFLDVVFLADHQDQERVQEEFEIRLKRQRNDPSDNRHTVSFSRTSLLPYGDRQELPTEKCQFSADAAPSIVIRDQDGDSSMEDGKLDGSDIQPSWPESLTITPFDSGMELMDETTQYDADRAQEILFAQICDVRTQIFDDPRVFDGTTDPRDPSEDDRQKFTRLNVVPRHTYFVLTTPSGTDVAVLNAHVSSCLRCLRESASIRYEGFVDVAGWREQIQAWKRTGNAGILLADINVYGPQKDSEKVGRVLSKARLYLQHPHCSNDGVIYNNPHYLSCSKTPGLELDVPTAVTASVQGSLSRPQYSVTYALEDLDQQGDLPHVEVDGRVTTPLLTHQTKGVDYITQQEADTASSAACLWKPNQDTPSGLVHLLPDTINVHKYHGSKRETDPLRLREFDLILTTYTTVTTEFSRGTSVLHRMNFFRLVLDEAHAIRHRETKQFRAVTTISAKHRWCLTGTPIQNSLDDLGALVQFLQVPLLGTSSSFRSHIVSPIESGCSIGFSHLRQLLKSLCLRRTNHLLQLPGSVTHYYRLGLSGVEDAQYANIGETYRLAFDRAVSGHEITKASNGILQAILRLRLLCNHGTYDQSVQALNGTSPKDEDEALTLLQQSDSAICAICKFDVSSVGKISDGGSGVFTVCLHLLCPDCVVEYEACLKEARQGKKFQCPLCPNLIDSSFLVSKGKGKRQAGPRSVPSAALPASSTNFDFNAGHSSKFNMLLKDIEENMHKNKSIIFSSWKKSLDLVGCLFTRKAIPFVSIDGSQPLSERKKSLSAFQMRPEVTVLLMTLGTGAVGLNLTIASRIHILEPQWNPSVENQAIGRALRLGQEKEVTIVRYVMKDTVEEYVESRQSKKLQLAAVGWTQPGESEEEQKLKKLMVCDDPYLTARLIGSR